MIEIIRIKNVALIEEVEVSFGIGLNIMSGETGAGKSIIIDSISFLLGQRPSSVNFIRTEKVESEVEGIFSIKNNEIADSVRDLGVEIGDDDLIVIKRTFNRNGKLTSRINGRVVPVGVLNEISAMLIDIHGQHEHQSLLNPKRHIKLLDRFCQDELSNHKELLSKKNKKYKELLKKIEDLEINEREKTNKIDLYSFQIDEILKSDLNENEEDNLLERRKLLLSSETLSTNVKKSIDFLNGDFENQAAIDKISESIQLLGAVVEIDSSKKELLDNLYSIEAELLEIVRDLRYYDDSLYFDPKELNEIEERLDVIYNLKRKYGNSVLEILEYLQNITEKLELINNSTEEINKLKKEIDLVYKEIISICEIISSIRKKESVVIEGEIIKHLQELGMKDAKFNINIEATNKFTNNGFDSVEFLISPNLGEPLKPLVQIASGGEMSRIMLALKNVLAKVDNIDTFVFDEIDTGVSGRTAQKVAEKLLTLSKEKQILCITHLPQIASMADKHFLIEKKSDSVKTVTNIYKLDNQNSVKEIARLIGGAEITNQTLKTALEMIVLAKKIV